MKMFIDTGKNLGIAFFQGNDLKQIHTIKMDRENYSKVLFKFLDDLPPYIYEITVEKSKVYQSEKSIIAATSGDLDIINAQCGMIEYFCYSRNIKFFGKTFQDWGGTMSKGIVKARVLHRLTVTEKMLVEIVNNEHIFDAIGMGLSSVNRF